jgi:hypothetical protein
MTGNIFDNEPDLLSHLGGDKFVRIMDEVVDHMLNVIELLIGYDKNQLLAGTDKQKAISMMASMPEFKRG